jgi:hypothetical protein
MENASHEPNLPAALPAEEDAIAAAIELVLSNPEALAEIVSQAAPKGGRRDGWTPFARKLFLQVLAETGKITTACEYTGLSRRSAYDLQARDPLFAAGIDAASHLARNPLADTVREQAVDGVTDTVTRNGEVVAERHRIDLRFSMSVLARLDKRCDRAEELGSKHLAVVRNWGEWLDLVGKGDEEGARALLESGHDKNAAQCEVCEVPESGNPIEAADDLSEDCWRDDSGAWMTTFPPPPGFDGHENREWDGDSWYERACTREEADLLDAHHAAAEAQQQAELTAFAEAQRDQFFGKLRAEVATSPLPPREGHGVGASASEPC